MNSSQYPQSLEELKALVACKLDVDEFLDILGYTMFDLVEALEEEVADNFDELAKAVD